MIEKLKQTKLGKSLYRLSHTPGGGSLRKAAEMVQSSESRPAHLRARHKKHNRTQSRILTAFEQHHGGKS